MEQIIDAAQFWLRYKLLVEKDFPVVLQTSIPHSTLSTWKSKNKFPRVDEAYKIAQALKTTVEYLVTGQDSANPTCSSAAIQIAMVADQLDKEGRDTLKNVVNSLKLKYPRYK
jgi:transcriptional regulator with XRE-family HTH domain